MPRKKKKPDSDFTKKQKRRLESLADLLAPQDVALAAKLDSTNPIDAKLGRWAAAALRKYLSGEVKSLDTAFGVRGKRGDHSTRERDLEIGRQIDRFLTQGKTFVEIETEMNKAISDMWDADTLRKIHDRVKGELWAKELNSSDGKTE